MYFWNVLKTFLICFYTSSKLLQIFCMSVSLLVCLLPYWNKTNIGISPVLDDISFCNIMENFLGFFFTNPQNYICLVCVSLCYLAYLLTKISKTVIFQLIDETSFLFFYTIFECFYTSFKKFWTSCMSVSLLVFSIPYWNKANRGISLVLEEISFWIFYEHF